MYLSQSSASPIKYIKKKFPHFQPGRGIRKTFIPRNRFFSTKDTIKDELYDKRKTKSNFLPPKARSLSELVSI